MQHDPTGEAATGGGSHVEHGDDQVGALLLAHGVSEHSARVRIAHGAQVDPALRAPQVGKARDPHPVQGTLIPLAGAVVLMSQQTPPAALGRARARVQACETLATHRRGDHTHTHIHTRTHESMADARSPIRATRHLMLPGHRLIQTPPRHRALTPVGSTALPRIIPARVTPRTLAFKAIE